MSASTIPLLQAANAPDNDGVTPDFPFGAAVLLGDARYARYLSDGLDDESAAAIALQNFRFAGALHARLGIVELAVRNAFDRELRIVAKDEHGTEDWTTPGAIPSEASALISGAVRQARTRAQRDAESRALRRSHRPDATVTHDDVVAQLTWGTWVKLVGNPRSDESSRIQQRVWAECLHRAFPFADAGERGRVRLAKSLNYLRVVRNHEAHFDTLYEEARQINRIVGTCMSILASIDCRLTQGWLEAGELRAEARALLSWAGAR